MVVDLPLWKMMEFVSDDYSIYYGRIKKNVPNHQSAMWFVRLKQHINKSGRWQIWKSCPASSRRKCTSKTSHKIWWTTSIHGIHHFGIPGAQGCMACGMVWHGIAIAICHGYSSKMPGKTSTRWTMKRCGSKPVFPNGIVRFSEDKVTKHQPGWQSMTHSLP